MTSMWASNAADASDLTTVPEKFGVARASVKLPSDPAVTATPFGSVTESTLIVELAEEVTTV